MDKHVKELLEKGYENLTVCRAWGQKVDQKAFQRFFFWLSMRESTDAGNEKVRYARRFDVVWYREIDDLLCLAGVLAFRKRGLQWTQRDKVKREESYPVYEAVGRVLHLSVSAVKKTHHRALKTYGDGMPTIFRDTRARATQADKLVLQKGYAKDLAAFLEEMRRFPGWSTFRRGY